jgi:hypothetical protein
MENSITYLLRNYYTISSQNYRLFYDFNSTGLPVVQNVTGDLSISGYITGNNTENFYLNSGVVNFSGNSVFIDNSSASINTKDCTYFITYENKSLGDFVLLNCIETGSYNNSIYYKGYEFGVTANNYLYFNYYNSGGSQVFVSSQNMPDKSNVFLTLANNAVQFGSYDFIYQKLNVDLFPLDTNYIFNPTGIWISSNLNYTGLYSRNMPFRGNMEKFLCFSPSIPISDIRLINSGTVSNYISGGNIIQNIVSTGITGYATGMLPYFTGITGTTYGITGVITDEFGETYSGYGQIDLTGVLYTQQILPQYGIVYTPETVYINESCSIDPNLILKYGKSNLNLLFNSNLQDNINYIYNTGSSQISNIDNLKSKKANGFKYFNWVTNTNHFYEVWCDGLYQYSGTVTSSGDIYNITQILSGDYILDENGNIIFNNNFDLNDNVKIDAIIPNAYNTLYIDNFNLSNIALLYSGEGYYLNWPTNSQIFLNGQKLVSGNTGDIGISADYGIHNQKIFIKNAGVFYNLSNSILSAIVESGVYDSISSSSVISCGHKFLPGSSKAYRNGVRLDLNYDYIELANFDTNLGTGIFDINTDIIYNGNGGFN